MADENKYVPTVDFVHLHTHSDYSLLDGAAKINKLIERAKELGMPALALTDHGNMFGVLRFEQECLKAGIKPLIGCELYVACGSRHDNDRSPSGKRYYHLLLLCKTDEGYRNLSQLSSLGYTEGMNDGGIFARPRVDLELLRKYSGGLVCLSACLSGELPCLLLAGKTKEAEEYVRTYQEIFGRENYFIELQDHNIPEEKRVGPQLIGLARRLGVPMVVTNDIHYCRQEEWQAHEILKCIGFKKTLSDPNHPRFNGDHAYYMKSQEEMAALFPDYPEMITNTRRIADMCNCHIHQYKITEYAEKCLPVYQIPPEFKTQDDYVRHLVYTGLENRYPVITDEIRARAEYELGIIFQMGFSGYFLIVWDFINWSKQHDIPIGPGRGSGAGSLVAYAMAITDIDPFKYKLIFERFLNPERVSMPDFDIDICFEGRQDVIQYTRDKYGDDHVGHIVTFGTLKAKAVIADVGRVLDIPLSEVNMLKKLVPEGVKVHLKDAFAEPTKEHPDFGQLRPYYENYKKLFDNCFKLEDVNRNTSLHASGIVIGRSPLPDWAPVYKDSKTGKIAAQYTMDIIEPCGLIKFDYLGLKTLTLLKHAEHIIRKRSGFESFTVNTVPEDDAKTFDLFCAGDTVAVFQFESPGMQKILRQAQPRHIEEIVALNALYRPGPMDYIPDYIAGKWDPEKVHYPDPCLEDILKETYGVMVYQEQVMQVAQRIAGFSLGGADMLRRAMGKKKKDVLMAKKQEFIDGAVKNNFSAEHAAEIFEIMVPFAGYGFNKSHAAAYSVVAYRTAYLKANFPAEFIAANLTNEISSTDKLPEYIAEAHRMNIVIDPPDVNRSDKFFDVVDQHVVYGLVGIKGLGEAAAEEIIEKRTQDGPYTDFINFLDRVDLHKVTKKAVELLIKTGAFDKLGPYNGRELNRATLILSYEQAVDYCEHKKQAGMYGQMSLFEDTGEQEFTDFSFTQSDEWVQLEKLRIEKELLGFYVSGHPLDQYEKAVKSFSTISSLMISDAELSKTITAERKYTIIGILTEIRPIQTKKGDWMAVGKIEDFTGTVNITIFPRTWTAVKDSVQLEKILCITGSVDTKRDDFPLIVDTVSSPDKLKEKSITEVHIELDNAQVRKDLLLPLKNTLFEAQGNCTIIMHIMADGRNYTVKTAAGLSVPSDDGFLTELDRLPCVKSVWKE